MSRDVSVAALRQSAGPGIARAAARKRKLTTTGEGRRAGWVSYAILSVVILISVFPLYYAFSIASQASPDTQYGIQALKFGSGLARNLRTAFDAIEFWKALSGSVFVSLVCAASTVLFSTLAGYSFAKLRFRGRGPLLFFVIATMAIPTQLAVVPLYLIMAKLHLYGTITAVIVPALVTAFGVFWMTQYLEAALPYELIEAARMDGCSMISTFWHIALPAARPAAAMLALFTFVAQWTNYFWPMLILGKNKNAVLTVAAANLKGGHFTDYTLIMSGVVLTAFPLIVLFFFAGRQLVSGIMSGAIKG